MSYFIFNAYFLKSTVYFKLCDVSLFALATCQVLEGLVSSSHYIGKSRVSLFGPEGVMPKGGQCLPVPSGQSRSRKHLIMVLSTWGEAEQEVLGAQKTGSESDL